MTNTTPHIEHPNTKNKVCRINLLLNSYPLFYADVFVDEDANMVEYIKQWYKLAKPHLDTVIRYVAVEMSVPVFKLPDTIISICSGKKYEYDTHLGLDLDIHRKTLDRIKLNLLQYRTQLEEINNG